MTRMEEYQALQGKLSQQPSGLEDTLARAKRRLQRRNRRIVRTCGSLCAVFVLFVALVNFCVPVAYACSRIPGLRELAQAVTFSRSLSAAVENEYVQPLSLTQTRGGITAKVEYLIVDQKQVNVFFRLESTDYETLEAEPAFRLADGSHIGSCIYGMNDHDVPVGQLQSAMLEVTEGDLPAQLQLTLEVYSRDNDGALAAEVAPSSDGTTLTVEALRRETVEFTFLLEYDPAFTAAPRIYPVEQTVELDGQRVTIRQVEVYPTHLRVQVADDPENTATLQRLFFYIETDWGMRFDTESNGVLSFRSGDSLVTTYRADSTYFYQADHLRLVITAAEWLDKDQQPVYVDLANNTAGAGPEGVIFLSARQTDEGWAISFKSQQRKWASAADVAAHQLIRGYRDAQGEESPILRWSGGGYDDLAPEEWEDWFVETIYLDADYADDQVWLLPQYSSVWRAEEPVTVEVR